MYDAWLAYGHTTIELQTTCFQIRGVPILLSDRRCIYNCISRSGCCWSVRLCGCTSVKCVVCHAPKSTRWNIAVWRTVEDESEGETSAREWDQLAFGRLLDTIGKKIVHIGAIKGIVNSWLGELHGSDDGWIGITKGASEKERLHVHRSLFMLVRPQNP